MPEHAPVGVGDLGNQGLAREHHPLVGPAAPGDAPDDSISAIHAEAITELVHLLLLLHLISGLEADR